MLQNITNTYNRIKSNTEERIYQKTNELSKIRVWEYPKLIIDTFYKVLDKGLEILDKILSVIFY